MQTNVQDQNVVRCQTVPVNGRGQPFQCYVVCAEQLTSESGVHPLENSESCPTRLLNFNFGESEMIWAHLKSRYDSADNHTGCLMLYNSSANGGAETEIYICRINR